MNPENQYKILRSHQDARGLQQMPLMASYAYYKDPKHLGFSAARYKFVAKMLDKFDRVLEVGCGDAFFSRIVKQGCKHLDLCDIDPRFMETIKLTGVVNWSNKIFLHDMTEIPAPDKYDAIYCLDVLEHIPPPLEEAFLGNIMKSLNINGVFICGMPSLESQAYASEGSKSGHVNCQSQAISKEQLSNHFPIVFAFSMNDEVIHTGFGGMSHYNLFICTNPANNFKV